MTEHDVALALALSRCGGTSGFVDGIAHIARTSPERQLTPRQAHALRLMAWRFRRQLPGNLIPPVKPAPLPPRERSVRARKGRVGPAEAAYRPDAATRCDATGDLFAPTSEA